MKILEDFEHLAGQPLRFVFVEMPALLEERIERLPLDVGLNQAISRLAAVADLVTMVDVLGDRWMIDAFERLGLALEELERLRLVDTVEAQDFDGDLAAGLGIFGEVGPRLSTPSDVLEDAKASMKFNGGSP